jgi:hypothetical protein
MNAAEKECDQLNTRLARYGQNVSEHRAKNPSRTMSDWRSLETQTVSQTMFESSQTMSGRVGQSPVGGFWKHELRPKSAPFFPNLILEL